jgi:hypothetical protein
MYVVSFQQRSKVESQKFVIGINHKRTQKCSFNRSDFIARNNVVKLPIQYIFLEQV